MGDLCSKVAVFPPAPNDDECVSVCRQSPLYSEKYPEPRNNKLTIFHIHNKDRVRKHINKPKQDKPLEYNVKSNNFMLINISEEKKGGKRRKHQNIMLHGNNLSIFHSYIGHGFVRYWNMQFLFFAWIENAIMYLHSLSILIFCSRFLEGHTVEVFLKTATDI